MARKWPGLILPFFILFFLWSNMLWKPKDLQYVGMVNDGSVHLIKTTLSDTLGIDVFVAMGVQDVTGIRLQKGFNKYSAYFEYHGSAEKILAVLSSLPVRIQNQNADVTCGEIPFPEFVSLAREMSTVELEQSANFWTASFPSETVYDCIKPPFRHTIIVNADQSTIRHRIEFNG
jgi:hypothetical protein